ncbi:MAG: hypothetical protein IH831_02670 [Planctomycetes bacterium]|nr:hypothetical protein [Planctomycetota bacterium]
MTRYTVLWDEDVQSQYIQAWIAGDFVTREVLTEIANWVDKNLVEDPDREGFARPDLSARIAVVPLASSSARVSVTFQVFPEDRQVRVVRLIFRL